MSEDNILDNRAIVEDFQMVSSDPQRSPVVHKGKFLKLPFYKGDSEKLHNTSKGLSGH